MLPKENSTLAESQAMLDQQKKTAEKKPSKFSLKWLLRRTRETKTPAGQSEKPNNGKGINNIPKSKSLDVSLTLTTRKDQQHLPSSASMNDKDKICNLGVPYLKMPRKISACGLPAKSLTTASQMFKTSYSSNDVQTLLAPNNSPSLQIRDSSSMARLKNQEPGSSGCYAPIHKPSPLARSRDKLSSSDLSGLKSKQLFFPELPLKNVETKDRDTLGTPGTSLSKINLIPMPYPPSIYNSNASGLNIIGGSNLLCRLCLMLVPARDLYTFEECSCVFCFTCIKQYLTINIREGNVNLSCPDAKCGKKGLINIREVEQLVEREVFDMYQRFKLNREVELDPTRTWCPGIDCETICYVRPSSDKKSGVLVHCSNCQFKFCSSCKDHWHSNKTCEQVHKEKHEELAFLVEQDDDPRIKRCPNPNCRVPIERDEGCAQMMCKQCKHVFCWYCLTSLDDDFLLRHYDKGPCKNKLGHSRASVVWHRTQVVGIFAGFGFLLLVASPLLLLAAPCLLCCRCKQCTKFFDEEPSAV